MKHQIDHVRTHYQRLAVCSFSLLSCRRLNIYKICILAAGGLYDFQSMTTTSTSPSLNFKASQSSVLYVFEVESLQLASQSWFTVDRDLARKKPKPVSDFEDHSDPSGLINFLPFQNSSFTGVELQKLRRVMSGIDCQLFLYCLDTHIFLFKGNHPS